MEKKQISETIELSDEEIRFLESFYSGDIDLIYYRRKPKKHYKKASKIQYAISRRPQFMLCVLARCKLINECWDLKTCKWKKATDYSCALRDYWFKQTKKLFSGFVQPYKKLEHIRLSNFETSLIIAVLNSFYNQGKNPRIRELLNKLENCDYLEIIKVKR